MKTTEPAFLLLDASSFAQADPPAKACNTKETMRKHIAATTLCLLLLGCNDASEQHLSITLPTTIGAEAKQLLQTNIPKLQAACKGLDKYASALQFTGAEDNFNYAPPNAQRASLIFKIADNDTQIPSQYRASGNNCAYEISRDGSKITIPKNTCASICLDKEIPSDQSDPFTIPIQ